MNRTVLDQINDINKLFARADAYLADAQRCQTEGRAAVNALASDFGITPANLDHVNIPEAPYGMNGSGPYPLLSAPPDVSGGGVPYPAPDRI